MPRLSGQGQGHRSKTGYTNVIKLKHLRIVRLRLESNLVPDKWARI